MLINTFKNISRSYKLYLKIGVLINCVIFSQTESSADITVKKAPENNKIICSIWLNKFTTDNKIVKHLGKDEERIALNMEEGAYETPKVGFPAIPFLEYRILLPYGIVVKEITTESFEMGKQILTAKINFIPSPINPEDYADAHKRLIWENSLKENSGIYKADALYPDKIIGYEQKIYRGFRVLHLKVTPFQYNPAKNELIYNRHIVCAVLLEKEAEKDHIPDIYIRNKKNDIEFIKKLVVNDEEIASYHKVIK